MKNEIKNNNNIYYEKTMYFDENTSLKRGKKKEKRFGEMKDI